MRETVVPPDVPAVREKHRLSLLFLIGQNRVPVMGNATIFRLLQQAAGKMLITIVRIFVSTYSAQTTSGGGIGGKRLKYARK